MARKGRPRKTGVKRSKTGRIIQPQEDARGVVIAQRLRLVEKPTGKERLTDPEWGYELGRLFVTGKISHREHEAGKRYADLVARYTRIKGFPSPNVRASSLEPGGGRSLASEPDADAIRRVSTAMHEASERLFCADPAWEAVVRRACVEDLPVVCTRDLRAALIELADFWQIPEQKQAA